MKHIAQMSTMLCALGIRAPTDPVPVQPRASDSLGQRSRLKSNSRLESPLTTDLSYPRYLQIVGCKDRFSDLCHAES